MSESFTFDVAYDTTFQQIEALRERMLAFLSNERRDYVTVFDIEVVGMFGRFSDGGILTTSNTHSDFPGQTKMTLAVDIKYKSNIQQSALKGT
jgi:small-conductance mechanosensitive channel